MSKRLLVAILAVASVLRVGVVAGTDAGLLYDAGDYHRHALSIAGGDGYPDTDLAAPGTPSALRPPLYPYLLGGVYALSGDSVDAARLVGALLGVLAVFGVFALGRAMFSERAGLIAAGLAAVSPSLVYVNASLISEQLFVPLVLALAWAVVVVRRRETVDWRWAVLLGVLCGLAALTRVIGVVLLVPAILALWRGPLGVRAVAMPLLAVVAAALTIAPWTVRNYVAFDRFVALSTQEGFNLYGTYNAESAAIRDPPATWHFPPGLASSRALFNRPGVDEAEISDELGARARSYILDHPSYPLEVAYHNAGRIFFVGEDRELTRVEFEQMGVPAGVRRTVELTVLGLLGLAALGALLMLRRRVRPGPLALWLIPLALLAGALFFLASPRYRLPLDAFLALLAAAGLATLGGRPGQAQQVVRVGAEASDPP